MAKNDDVLLLTVEEAAERLNISRTMMFGLMRSGMVRSVKIGRLRRIPAEGLHEYVAEMLAANLPADLVPEGGR